MNYKALKEFAYWPLSVSLALAFFWLVGGLLYLFLTPQKRSLEDIVNSGEIRVGCFSADSAFNRQTDDRHPVAAFARVYDLHIKPVSVHNSHRIRAAVDDHYADMACGVIQSEKMQTDYFYLPYTDKSELLLITAQNNPLTTPNAPIKKIVTLSRGTELASSQESELRNYNIAVEYEDCSNREILHALLRGEKQLALCTRSDFNAIMHEKRSQFKIIHTFSEPIIRGLIIPRSSPELYAAFERIRQK